MKTLTKVILCMIILAAILFALYKFNVKQHEAYIAIVGPMSGCFAKKGRAMCEGARLYHNMLKKSGALKNLKIHLVAYDDQNDPEKARQIARQIANNDKILLVLGHHDNRSSIKAGEIYQHHKIPAITASASDERIIDTNEWYFRIIPGNDIQSTFVANFIQNELNLNQVEFLLVGDQRKLNLKSSFTKACKKINLPVHIREINLTSDENSLESLVLDFQSNDQPVALFLAANDNQSAEIVTALKYPGANITIVGYSNLAMDTFIDQLKQLSFQENATPGYHSDNIFAATPFLTEMGNEQSQLFKESYVSKFGKTPSWLSYTYYDAMKTAVTAIRRSGMFLQKDIHKKRQLIRDSLADMNTKKNSVQGLTGDIYFNRKGSVEAPYYFGVYHNQQLISSFSQFQIIPQNTDVNLILDQVLEGSLIKVKNRYMRKTEIVYTGIDINEIKDLNLTERTFDANFYIWFRYKKQFTHAVDIRFENSQHHLEINNGNHPKVSMVFCKEKNNIIIQAFRVNGTFKGEFNFRAFPFDTHKLTIKFRNNKLSRDKVIYIPDLHGMEQDQEIKAEITNRSHALEGWNITNVIYYQNMFRNESSLGDPEAFKSKNQIVFSRFNTEIHIMRKIVNYLIKNLFLILVLIVISYITYFIPPDQFSIRISIGMSTLLTSAFSHVKLSNSIPVAYLLALEYSFFGVYAVASLSIIISVLIYKNFKKLDHIKQDKQIINKATKLMKRLTVIGLIFHPLIIFISSILIPSVYILNPTNFKQVNSVSIACIIFMIIFCFFFTRIKEVKSLPVKKENDFFE